MENKISNKNEVVEKPSFFKTPKGRTLKTYIPAVIGIVGLFILGEILSNGFISLNNISNLLTNASLLAIAAVGQTMVVISGGGGIDMSLGSVMSFGALLGPALIDGKSEMLVPALLLLIIVGGFVGIINGLGIRIAKIPPLVMTLIMSSVVDGYTVAFTKGVPNFSIIPEIDAIGLSWFWVVRPLLIIAIIFIIIMELVLKKTRFGKQLYMVGSNPNAARLAGVKSTVIVVAAYAIAGAIYMVAGLLLLGYTGSAQMQMAEEYTLMSVAAVVIGGVSLDGGKGSLLGGALGAIVLVLLSSILYAVKIPEGARDFIQGCVLLVILLINSRQAQLRQ